MRMVVVAGIGQGHGMRGFVAMHVSCRVMVVHIARVRQRRVVMIRTTAGHAGRGNSLHGKRNAQQAHQHESPDAGHGRSLVDGLKAVPRVGIFRTVNKNVTAAATSQSAGGRATSSR